MSKIRIDDLFELNGNRYITLDKTVYNSNEYLFVNMLADGESPTNVFIVFKCVEDKLFEEKDEAVLKEVLSVFSENMNEKLAIVNEQNLSKED